jgi:hypothetical protein
MEYDETFYSQRKYARGSRVRQAGTMVFCGGVEYEPLTAGRRVVLDGVIQGITSKQTGDVVPLIAALVAPGGDVQTDCAKMHRNIAEELGVEHNSLNHSVSFVATDASGRKIHTNGVEGWWNRVKSALRAWFKRQPNDNGNVQRRFQLAAFHANWKATTMHPT